METNIAFYTVVALAWLSSVNAITASPGKNITEGNCNGPLDFFLCNCVGYNTNVFLTKIFC